MKADPLPGIRITWLGHSAFAIKAPSGKTVLIDPWLDNPRAPEGAAATGADVILVSHGHSDHLGSTIPIAARTGARVFCIHELSLYLKGKGVSQAEGMNKGGTVGFDGLSITMVDAKHSAGIDGGGAVIPGGEAAGYVIQFGRGLTLYHAGDTALFGDMKLIGQLYGPDVVMLPIGGLYTMGPREAAYACTLLKPRHIIGMHYGTFPQLSGTPAALRKHLPASLKQRVIELTPGKAITLR